MTLVAKRRAPVNGGRARRGSLSKLCVLLWKCLFYSSLGGMTPFIVQNRKFTPEVSASGAFRLEISTRNGRVHFVGALF